MTIQQLKNEIVENLIAEYVAKLNFNGCVGEIFIADLAQKAYQAGREEALEEVERDVENSKKMIGVDIQDISPTGLSYNNALSGILNIIQKLKVNK